MMIKDLLKFLDEAKTKYKTIELTKQILKENGFIEVSESDSYSGLNNFFVTRNDSSIIVINKPNDFFKKSMNIVCTHTDSPSFKINENSEVDTFGYKTLQTEVYGGPIYSSWFDRPLGIGGRVYYKSDDEIKKEYVEFDNACVIPNLCIHFNRDVNTSHKYEMSEMKPILSMKKNVYDLIKNKYKINKSDIYSLDLELYNAQSPTTVGDNEFFMASRIDNLASHFIALTSFIDKTSDDKKSIIDSSKFMVFASFDNEEVGSRSMAGAASSFLNDTLKRVFTENGCSENDYLRQQSNSIALSADNAHAIHPNYVAKSDTLNAPILNKGFVIKENPSLKYTTDAISKAILKKLCDDNKIKYQIFHNNPSVAGGSTLGNILQSSLSIHMVDIGLPQLAMHSAYEMGGVNDIKSYYKIMYEFYNSDIKISNDKIIIKN